MATGIRHGEMAGPKGRGSYVVDIVNIVSTVRDSGPNRLQATIFALLALVAIIELVKPVNLENRSGIVTLAAMVTTLYLLATWECRDEEGS